MTVFDDAVHLKEQSDGSWLGHTNSEYGGLVAPFGGITAAVMLNAVMSHGGRVGQPVALTVNFAAPVTDGAYQIHSRIARSNRTTQYWSMELLQEGKVAATGTSVCAIRRATWSAQEATMPQGLPRPESLPRAPLGGLPPWARHYDKRVVSGDVPALDGQEQADSETCLWLRDDPPRPLDFLSLAAICDNFIPRIIIRRRKVAPVATVSMTTYFHADGGLLLEQADRYVLGVARALNFRKGFFDQSAEIWSDGGQLLAGTHQIVYFLG
jgi:hypothetical protein